ncbi:hypothetical protein ACI8AG_03390 [Blastococcus sp. SYSU DS0552]
MGGVLAAALLLLLLAGIVVWIVSTPQPWPAAGRLLPAREREWRARAVAAAHWHAAHDEVDGMTRVLLRRSCPGPDGHPEVLEDRVFDSFPADDPMWEARFTEAMAGARFRCSYLNTEEGEA